MKPNQINIEDYDKGISIFEKGDTVVAEFFYPRIHPVKHVEIGLSDVRASDSIRAHYDFERDGWVVEQSYINEVQKDGYIDATGEQWEEVGFFGAWALESKGTKID